MKIKLVTSPRFHSKMKSAFIIGVGGIAAFCGINIYKGDEKFYRHCLMPVVHKLDPERAHRLGIFVLKHKLIASQPEVHLDFLKTSLWGLQFNNPIGIAAGFDKNGEAIEGLDKLGFGFIEVGTVTPQPQPGNEKPRVFRLVEDKAIINRYGFNSDGHDAVYNHIKCARDNGFNGIIGVNLGKNKTSSDAIQDYVDGVKKFGLIADYLVINVSSPNTPGLRGLQEKENLRVLLDNVIKTRNQLPTSKTPIVLKLSPDLSAKEKEDVANIILDKRYRVDGLIITNTTTTRPNDLRSVHKTESGGLSGEPLTRLTGENVKEMHKLTKGLIPIIAAGGISNGANVVERLSDGASLVQLYTSFAFEGPPIVTRIKREMQCIKKEGKYQSEEKLQILTSATP